MPKKQPFVAYHGMETLTALTGLPFAIEKVPDEDRDDTAMRHAHRHGFYLIGIQIEGESVQMLDFKRVTTQPKDMIMIVPGQIHEAITYSSIQGYLLAFSAEFLAGQPVQLPIAPTDKVSLPDEDFEQAKLVADLMHREYLRRSPHYIPLLQQYLSVLVMLLQRNACGTQQQGPELLIRYRELVATNFMQWTKPAQYAAELHISVDHLNEVVKQHTGQTASALISDRRILEAKRLLLHAKETVKEIAWHLQFNEVSYFNKFFKQHTGYTPASFREAVREKYHSIPE
jgi:AraC family transcriptional regulator, transcriptional activator of pobA